MRTKCKHLPIDLQQRIKGMVKGYKNNLTIKTIMNKLQKQILWISVCKGKPFSKPYTDLYRDICKASWKIKDSLNNQ